MIIIIIVPKKLTTTSASSLKNRFDHHLAAFALLSLAVLLFLPLPPGIQKYEISRCNYKSLQFQDAITSFPTTSPTPCASPDLLLDPLACRLLLHSPHLRLCRASPCPPCYSAGAATSEECFNRKRTCQEWSQYFTDLSTFSTAGGLSAHVPPSAVCQVHDPWTVGRGCAQMTQRGARALVELLRKIVRKNCLKQCSHQFFSPIAKDYFERLQSMEGKGGGKNNEIMQKGIPYSDSNSREQVILHF